ncbi:MAG TPA: hypothetical protein VD962_09580, partial [Rubricoccaceae bacterium]|nr:hypothetical protein [Rubricoccaceae bacterium]
GARLASADVLLFFNADVRLPEPVEPFVADLIAAAREHGAATCRVVVHPDEATLADRLVLGGCNAVFWAWNTVGRGMGRGECHAIRRDLFEAVGGYREHLTAGEDFDLFERLAKHARRTGGSRPAFLWRHVIYEDPRRYRQRGYARTLWAWFLNSASVTFLGRSYSRAWDAVR